MSRLNCFLFFVNIRTNELPFLEMVHGLVLRSHLNINPECISVHLTNAYSSCHMTSCMGLMHRPCLKHERMHFPLVVNKMGSYCHIRLRGSWTPSIARKRDPLGRKQFILDLPSFHRRELEQPFRWNIFGSVFHTLVQEFVTSGGNLHFRPHYTGGDPCRWM